MLWKSSLVLLLLAAVVTIDAGVKRGKKTSFHMEHEKIKIDGQWKDCAEYTQNVDTSTSLTCGCVTLCCSGNPDCLSSDGKLQCKLKNLNYKWYDVKDSDCKCRWFNG